MTAGRVRSKFLLKSDAASYIETLYPECRVIWNGRISWTVGGWSEGWGGEGVPPIGKREWNKPDSSTAAGSPGSRYGLLTVVSVGCLMEWLVWLV